MKPLDWTVVPLFFGLSVCFGVYWVTALQVQMDLKHPEENQSQTGMVLLIIFVYVVAFGFHLPFSIVFGVGSCAYFFNYPSPENKLNGSDDNAEYKEIRFPIWFTAPACILCLLLIPTSWRLLSNDCEKVSKQSQGIIPFAHISLSSFGYIHPIVFFSYFGWCIVTENMKKSLKTAKTSSSSDIENVQPKELAKELEFGS